MIVYHDVEHAAEMTERQSVSAHDLYDAGIVDLIVPERPEAHLDPVAFARQIAVACADQIRSLGAERHLSRPALGI